MPSVIGRLESAFISPGYGASGQKAGVLRRVVQSIHREIRIRRQRRMLRAMPDWMMKDVGINRSDIDSLAAGIVDGFADPTRRPRGCP